MPLLYLGRYQEFVSETITPLFTLLLKRLLYLLLAFKSVIMKTEVCLKEKYLQNKPTFFF